MCSPPIYSCDIVGTRGGSGRRRRLDEDEGEVHDDEIVERGHERSPESAVLPVAQARRQVLGGGEGQHEDVGEAPRERLLV